MVTGPPEAGIVTVAPSGPKPVVMFAGGYDMNKDLRTGVGTDDTEGNAVYVVDAETGELIWKAVGSGVALRLDFNGSLGADWAEDVLGSVARFDIEYAEQLVADPQPSSRPTETNPIAVPHAVE